MVRINGDIVINRPVDEVFDFVADQRNELRYNARMLSAVQTTPGPVGLGTQFRAETTSMGRAVPMTIEITTYRRPRQLASHTRLSSMDINGTLVFEPAAVGTRMRWSWELRPHGALKLIAPVVARVGRRQEQTIWSELKLALEGHGNTPPAPDA